MNWRYLGVLLLLPFVDPSMANAQQVLPTYYHDHRFYVQPVTIGGDTLMLATDTGGTLLIFSDVAERLQLKVGEVKDLRDHLGLPIPAEVMGQLAGQFALLPDFAEDKGIPSPLTPWGPLPALPVVARAQEEKEHLGWGDGLLGQSWFAGRIWIFDYPAQQLLLHEEDSMSGVDTAHRVALGFKESPDGVRESNFPRIKVTVGDESIDMLFDTGATTILTDSAHALLDDGRPVERATSFIAASVFERWRQRFPAWRVVELAERGSQELMIEARDIRIAGYLVDRAWFTRRPDLNFHESMSSMMDRRIDGAVGGNVLHHFRITVDYPNAAAVFEHL